MSLPNWAHVKNSRPEVNKALQMGSFEILQRLDEYRNPPVFQINEMIKEGFNFLPLISEVQLNYVI